METPTFKDIEDLTFKKSIQEFVPGQTRADRTVRFLTCECKNIPHGHFYFFSALCPYDEISPSKSGFPSGAHYSKGSARKALSAYGKMITIPENVKWVIERDIDNSNLPETVNQN